MVLLAAEEARVRQVLAYVGIASESLEELKSFSDLRDQIRFGHGETLPGGLAKGSGTPLSSVYARFRSSALDIVSTENPRARSSKRTLASAPVRSLLPVN